MNGSQVKEQPEDSTGPLRYVWVLVATLILVDVAAALVFVAAPSSSTVRGYFVSEDSLIENLTAGVFIGSSLLALFFLTSRRVRSKKSRMWLATLSALGLLAFLDEISFGERLLDIDMPVLGDTKIDAVHDLVDLGLNQLDRLQSDQAQLVLLVLVGGTVLLLAMMLRHGIRIRESIVTDRYYPVYLVAFIAILLGCSALALDTERFSFRGAKALEECFELNVALSLLASCLIVLAIETRSVADN